MATAVDDCAIRPPHVCAHALPSTLTLIDGRRLAGEQLFDVHDRYTEALITQVHAATQAQVSAHCWLRLRWLSISSKSLVQPT